MTMASTVVETVVSPTTTGQDHFRPPTNPKQKLHGRAFYESIGSPKFVLAPMVDQSEFAWRLLTRSFMTPEGNARLLAYSPMLHARLFAEKPKFRAKHFQPVRDFGGDVAEQKEGRTQPVSCPSTPDPPYLDGNPANDRPLTVQFCANDASTFLAAAQHVAPFCDAVDLNLGCPQGIARKGHYGAFLQEDISTIEAMISTLHRDLSVPVTAKIRILEDRKKTLDYARRIVDAGASILTIHGRTRDMKGHKTGLADWDTIRWVRDRLPAGTVVFANGNVLTREDIDACLAATGADGVMSAEGNLCDPGIFAEPPGVGDEGVMYWRGSDERGGWRMDEVTRRYMDIIYEYVLEVPAPVRKALYDPRRPHVREAEVDQDSADNLPAVNTSTSTITTTTTKKRPASLSPPSAAPAPSTKKQCKTKTTSAAAAAYSSPNLTAMQAHLFHMLRPLVARHTSIRDRLARCRTGDMAGFEAVLAGVERVCEEGIRLYASTQGESWKREEEEMERAMRAKQAVQRAQNGEQGDKPEAGEDDGEKSLHTVRHYRRPWWVVQPYVRPLPKEAFEKGSWALSKKEKKKKMEEEKAVQLVTNGEIVDVRDETRVEARMEDTMEVGRHGGPALERVPRPHVERDEDRGGMEVEVPRDGVVCG